MTTKHALKIGSALYGLAIALALRPHFAGEPAPPGQLPGFATAHGIDAHASTRFYLTIIALTIVVPLLLRPLLARLRPSIAMASWIGALWFATTDQDAPWVIAIGIAGAAAALIPYDARTRFRRADAMLVPTFATLFLAMIDLAPSLSLSKHAALAAGIVLATRLAAGSGDAFALAPLGLLLQAHFNAVHVRHLGWPSLLFAVVTPPILRFALRPRWRSRLRWTVAFVIYPIVALCFASASSKLAAEGKPHGDLFEDAHHFVVASEMLRGEKPYADIVPIHGFIEDGLLDYVTARGGPVSEGRLAKMHGVVSALNAVAAYAVAAAATGSPDVGILSFFLGVTLGLGGGALRLLPGLAALAFMVSAIRRKYPRHLAYAGALVVLAALTSLDFGAYAFVALVAAVLLMPRSARLRGALAALLGVGIAGIVVVVGLASFGILGAFVRTTLFEIVPVGTASSLGLPPLPPAFPEVLTQIFTPRGFALIALAVFLVALAVLRNRVLIVLAVFVVAAGAYFFERQQLYFAYALPPLVAASIFFLFRGARAIAIAALAVVLVAANLTNALITLTALWNARGPLGEAAEVDSVPRARGALFTPGAAKVIEDVDRYARERLGLGDTFFDFADVPNLYFLLNRDCPVRQIAVPFYESEPLQRDVIARIERNLHVRAALVRPDANGGIDGVPNSVRAPLVWRYLQTRFTPDVQAGDIVIWRRVW